jgi:hypothetical protein
MEPLLTQPAGLATPVPSLSKLAFNTVSGSSSQASCAAALPLAKISEAESPTISGLQAAPTPTMIFVFFMSPNPSAPPSDRRIRPVRDV